MLCASSLTSYLFQLQASYLSYLISCIAHLFILLSEINSINFVIENVWNCIKIEMIVENYGVLKLISFFSILLILNPKMLYEIRMIQMQTK